MCFTYKDEVMSDFSYSTVFVDVKWSVKSLERASFFHSSE